MTPQQEAAMQLGLEALEANLGKWAAKTKAIPVLRQVLADHALNKKAENARELELDYEPSAGTQVSKVWWDGEKLMAKPIPLESVYKEPEHQEPKQSEIFCGVDFADGMLSVSVLRRRSDHVAELLHSEQIELNTRPQAPEPVIDKSAAIRIATALGWEPKREWVGLTDEDIGRCFDDADGSMGSLIAAIEAKLREKNT